MKKCIFGLSMLVFPIVVNASEINDYADVVEVRSIITQVSETVQNCTNETTQSHQDRSYTGPVVGGVAGAILGNQVGQGNGKVAATAGGAIVGTMVGEHLGNGNSRQQTTQRCRPYTSVKNVQNGYEVTYRYNGKIGRTSMHNAPGSQIRVGVNAE